MKVTSRFEYMRRRPDRAEIRDEWIVRTINDPLAVERQADGRIRKWAWIEEKRGYLRVIRLDDGETVHNAFFDRRFRLTGESK